MQLFLHSTCVYSCYVYSVARPGFIKKYLFHTKRHQRWCTVLQVALGYASALFTYQCMLCCPLRITFHACAASHSLNSKQKVVAFKIGCKYELAIVKRNPH